MLQILGVPAIVAMAVTLFAHPAGAVPAVLAIGLVGLAIVIGRNDVEQTRARRAATAAVTVRPPNATRAGS